MMRDLVNVTTQAELDQVVKDGNIPVVRSGYFEVFGSASVHAFGSASVRAFGSASVRAFGSASVRAFGSASVSAFGSASVRASDSASVHAFGSVAVHKHSPYTTINGGVLIEVPDLYADAKVWCDYYGLQVTRGIVTLYKLVDDEFVSGHGTSYAPGSKPEAPDWKPSRQCGNGLHFSPRPFMAHRYSSGSRYVACPVRVSELVAMGDKCKSRRVVGKGCWEVDEDGNPVETVGLAA